MACWLDGPGEGWYSLAEANEQAGGLEALIGYRDERGERTGTGY